MKKKEYIYKSMNEKDKNHLNFIIACEWLDKKIKNHHLSEYLTKQNIHSVAIYGVGELGKLLIEELAGSEVDIRYCIENGISNLSGNIKVISKNDNFEYVDAVIVTPCYYYYDIQQELKRKIDTRIISLEKIVYEM